MIFLHPRWEKNLSVKWFPVFLEKTFLAVNYSHLSEVHPFQFLPPSLSQQVHLLSHILSPEHHLSALFVFLSPPKGAGAAGSQRSAGIPSSPDLGVWLSRAGGTVRTWLSFHRKSSPAPVSPHPLTFLKKKQRVS